MARLLCNPFWGCAHTPGLSLEMFDYSLNGCQCGDISRPGLESVFFMVGNQPCTPFACVCCMEQYGSIQNRQLGFADLVMRQPHLKGFISGVRGAQPLRDIHSPASRKCGWEYSVRMAFKNIYQAFSQARSTNICEERRVVWGWWAVVCACPKTKHKIIILDGALAGCRETKTMSYELYQGFRDAEEGIIEHNNRLRIYKYLGVILLSIWRRGRASRAQKWANRREGINCCAYFYLFVLGFGSASRNEERLAGWAEGPPWTIEFRECAAG